MTADDIIIFYQKLNELSFDDLTLFKAMIQSLLNKKFKELHEDKGKRA